MIKAKDAIATARSYIGTPYSEMDCIALIRAVIKRSLGGVADYRCEGTNWLWASINNSSKYRHLIWRQESIEGARAGMLAFKRSGDDIHHVGLVTEKGTVIHSSSVFGYVAETELDGSWDLLGKHKHIAVLEEEIVRNKDTDIVPNDTEVVPNNTTVNSNNPKITIIDSVGNHFEPVGDWRTLVGGVD
ncbi:MAG: hypothetical protein IJ418_08090 [Clostridia bacterium]|nr:hypothetical protein [Clostridia bacterium]